MIRTKWCLLNRSDLGILHHFNRKPFIFDTRKEARQAREDLSMQTKRQFIIGKVDISYTNARKSN